MENIYFKRGTIQDFLSHPDYIVEGFIKSGMKDNFTKNSIVGIKIHFGEEGNKSFINPRILRDLVKFIKKIGCKVFIFDTNTLYRGKRMNAIDHIELAYSHGFGALNIPIIIGDGIRGNDYIEVDINKKNFKKVYLASILKDIDYLLVLSHFTGHMLSGFGCAIKNLAMGCAARRGKLQQHCNISPTIKEEKCKVCGICFKNCPAQAITLKSSGKYWINNNLCIGCAQCISLCPYGAIHINWWENYNIIMERIVEYAYGVFSYKKSGFINFCLYITKDCDCMNKEKEGIIKDVGVLWGNNPLTIDKASIDLIIQQEGKDILREIYPNINYQHQLDYAVNMGLGTLEYQLHII